MAASRSDATSLPTFDGVENLIKMTDIQKAFDELCVEEVCSYILLDHVQILFQHSLIRYHVSKT